MTGRASGFDSGFKAEQLKHVAPLMVAVAQKMLKSDAHLRFGSRLLLWIDPRLNQRLPNFRLCLLKPWLRRWVEQASPWSAMAPALEVALVGTPHVITYRTSPLHWLIGNAGSFRAGLTVT